MRQRIPLIATTRPEGYTKSLYSETDFQRMSLAALDRTHQEQIIENRVGRQGVQELRPHLDTMIDGEGKSICSNPLMLSMIVSLYRSGGGTLASSRFGLYEKAVGMMLGQVDFKQLGEIRAQAVDLDAAQRLLRNIAVSRHIEKEKDISKKEIESAVREDEALRLAWRLVEAQVTAGRLPILRCLEQSPLKLRFAHLSFQEFFSLEYFREKPAELPLTSTLISDGWWHNLLKMGCDADGSRFADAVLGRETALSLKNTRMATNITDDGVLLLVRLLVLMQSRVLGRIELEDNPILPIQEPKGSGSVQLSQGVLNERGARIISALAQENGALRSLTLKHLGIDNISCGVIAESIRDHTSLIRLDLSQNEVTNCDVIFTALQSNAWLSYLDLSKNAIVDCDALAPALRMNASLVHLDLSGNMLTNCKAISSPRYNQMPV